MSSFELTRQYEAITEDVSEKSLFRNEASLTDPRSNYMIGAMNQGNQLEMFPSADSLLSGFPSTEISMPPSGDQMLSAPAAPMQELPLPAAPLQELPAAASYYAPASAGSALDFTNGSEGGGILAGLSDLTGGNGANLSAELQQLLQCCGVGNMMGGSGLDNMMGGSGLNNLLGGSGLNNLLAGSAGDSSQSGGGMNNLVSEAAPLIQELPAIAGMAAAA